MGAPGGGVGWGGGVPSAIWAQEPKGRLRLKRGAHSSPRLGPAAEDPPMVAVCMLRIFKFKYSGVPPSAKPGFYFPSSIEQRAPLGLCLES